MSSVGALNDGSSRSKGQAEQRLNANSSTAEEQSCWVPLFANPVIARGFTVPRRYNHEQGLEIPFEMMAALGGARHVTEFDGGLVLKGYSSLFVPVKRHADSVQWHFIRKNDEERLLYREVKNGCSDRALLESVDHESLITTRTFLGWWKSAETHLGTADADYNSIDWSPPWEARRSARFSGAEIGFQSMATGKLNFIMGAKDGRMNFAQKGPFQRMIQRAEKTAVILYDLKDRRAWLVPALDVMLHIIQTRHHTSPYNLKCDDVEIVAINPKKIDGTAAREAVFANQRRSLYEGFLFQDGILDIWSHMERLMERDDSLDACSGLALHGTLRSRLHGWKNMSLVHEKNYRRKDEEIKKSSGGWVGLIVDVDALVLFATGFKEIIKPVFDLNRLCQRWRSLPKDKDYLASGVPMLELLYSEAGSRCSRKHLSTNHLQWHRGSSLFEQCCLSLGECKCDRTQQIYHDSLFRAFGHVRPPGELEKNGCVIFDQANHALKPTKIVTRRENSVHNLPNVPVHCLKASSPKAEEQLAPTRSATFVNEHRGINGSYWTAN